jgi:hypothetical protein
MTAKAKKGKGPKVTSCRKFEAIDADNVSAVEASPLSSMQSSVELGGNALAQALIKTHGCNEENDFDAPFELSCMPGDRCNLDWVALGSDYELTAMELSALRSYIGALRSAPPRSARDGSSRRMMLAEGIAGTNMAASDVVGGDSSAVNVNVVSAVASVLHGAITRQELDYATAAPADVNMTSELSNQQLVRAAGIAARFAARDVVGIDCPSAHNHKACDGTGDETVNSDDMHVASEGGGVLIAIAKGSVAPVGKVAKKPSKKTKRDQTSTDYLAQPSPDRQHVTKATKVAKSPTKSNGGKSCDAHVSSRPVLFEYPTPSLGVVDYAGALVVGCTVQLKMALDAHPTIRTGCRGRLLSRTGNRGTLTVEWTVGEGRVVTTNLNAIAVYCVSERK